MQQSLLMVERIVLEALNKGAKNLVELKQDTGLAYGPLHSILCYFLDQQVIEFKQGRYSINEQTKQQWLAQINDPEAIKLEVKELFTAMVNNYFSQAEQQTEREKQGLLKVQKVWLTPSEERVLKSYFQRIDSFMQDLAVARKAAPVQCKTAGQKVVIWGASTYLNLVEASCKAV